MPATAWRRCDHPIRPPHHSCRMASPPVPLIQSNDPTPRGDGPRPDPGRPDRVPSRTDVLRARTRSSVATAVREIMLRQLWAGESTSPKGKGGDHGLQGIGRDRILAELRGIPGIPRERAIAEEIGVSSNTVRSARQKSTAQHCAVEPLTSASLVVRKRTASKINSLAEINKTGGSSRMISRSLCQRGQSRPLGY
jgi:hypothetical protein